MKNKGKRKEKLYQRRRMLKIARRKKNRLHKYPSNLHGYANTEEAHNIVGANYLKVLRHLKEAHFELPLLQCRFRKEERIQIPEVFSMTENPETVIQYLRKIYSIGKGKKTEKLIFDHSACKQLGLSASTILDIIVLAMVRYRDTRRHPMDLAGKNPRDKVARDILLASGLPYHLNAEFRATVDETNMERFETVSGVYDMSANKADKTATSMTEYFNRCLKTQNYELTEEGLNRLSNMLGEVITNCEIHGDDNTTWYTQGHYQMKDENSYGEMQLLFLNIGPTIYDGLKKSSSADTERRLCHILSKQHKNMDSMWTEEMVYTLFALQEGISRLRDDNISGYAARGSGTVSLIESFYDIGGSDKGLKPQMSVISGSTQIVFTDKYKLQDVWFESDIAFGRGCKKIIAFNEENDIYKRADNNYVRKLNEYFPGTIISLKFYLDRQYIARRKAGN